MPAGRLRGGEATDRDAELRAVEGLTARLDDVARLVGRGLGDHRRVDGGEVRHADRRERLGKREQARGVHVRPDLGEEARGRAHEVLRPGARELGGLLQDVAGREHDVVEVDPGRAAERGHAGGVALRGEELRERHGLVADRDRHVHRDADERRRARGDVHGENARVREGTARVEAVRGEQQGAVHLVFGLDVALGRGGRAGLRGEGVGQGVVPHAALKTRAVPGEHDHDRSRHEGGDGDDRADEVAPGTRLRHVGALKALALSHNETHGALRPSRLLVPTTGYPTRPREVPRQRPQGRRRR